VLEVLVANPPFFQLQAEKIYRGFALSVALATPSAYSGNTLPHIPAIPILRKARTHKQ
jgi:hypothetical protein